MLRTMQRLALDQVADASTPDANEIGWFAARQPGVVAFLESRCGATDAFAVAIEGSFRLCSTLEQRDGVPPARIPTSLLERAEESLELEALAPVAGGCADRQPDLVAWIAALAHNPPIPLSAAEARTLTASLLAILYALDELTTGRPVP